MVLSTRLLISFVLVSGLLLGSLAVGCGGGSEESAQPVATSGAPDGASNDVTGNGDDAGSGDDNGSREGGEGQVGGSESRAEAAFVKEADEICSRRRLEVLARVESYVREKAGGGQTVAARQAEAVDSLFVPNLEAQIREIRQLESPPGQEAQVEAFLEAMEEGLATTKREDYTAANVEGLGSEYGWSDALAKRLGVFSCSFGG